MCPIQRKKRDSVYRIETRKSFRFTSNRRVKYFEQYFELVMQRLSLVAFPDLAVILLKTNTLNGN